ncbi:MAG: mechanosensitive ion channel domain-containing protein [Pseudoxanthomonas sp.]
MSTTPDIGHKLEKAGDAVRDVANDSARAGWDGLQPLLEFQLLHVSGMNITVGGLLLAVLVALGVWLVSRLVRRALTRYAQRNPDVNQAALYTFARLVNYVLVVLGAMWAMDAVGIPLGKLSLFAGAIGVGLGFGLQAIFSNFISGLILLFDRSLKVGDFVELASGARGEVKDIKIRATRIGTNDNIDVLVPNSEFITGHVVNWTHRDVSRRLHIPFGVAYGTDKDLARTAALEAAAELSFTLTGNEQRKAQVWLVGFGDSALNFELVVWLTAAATKRPGAVQAAYNWALHTALEKHGIEIPFPQRDLHVRSLFGRAGDEGRELLRDVSSADARVLAQEFAGVRALREARGPAGENDAQREVQRQIDSEPASAHPNDDADAGPATPGAEHGERD